ncbi:hypothetical protein GGI25_002249 [Coemansia spiralis]|uniref:Peptide hydrolase n=1 Tax=Coemansia spiralis TaxID=417178 RepID=A0A9W8GAP9_9FUNG|nr:hypothetical protein GGI25_002249 [Coemansia spiralis]
MIPDEKKPIPWGLPPLRSEVIARQRAQQQLPSAEASGAVQTTSMPKEHHYVHNELDGYMPLSDKSSNSSNNTSTSHCICRCRQRTDFMSLRKRIAVLLGGMALLTGALFVAYRCTCDPNVINPAMFSATTRDVSADTLDSVQRLLGFGFDENNTVAWDRLAEMTDLYGHRMTASKAYDRSAEWVVHMAGKHDGLHAHTEPVVVNEWRRGKESLQLLVPSRPGGKVELAVLGLGNSVATPESGLEADVVPVHSFEELEQLGSAGVAGKVVLFNFPYTGYSSAGKFRSRGAQMAEKHGAVAVLVRTLAPDTSFYSVHTGSSMRAAIPAASISLADANLIERMYRRARLGQSPDHVWPRVRLSMHSRLKENAKQSANVIIELKGSEAPEQIVLLSGHFDSWDVGVGAMDDGAGAFLAWEATRLVSLLPRAPKRTIRVVMWNNEETLQRGAKAYYSRHRAEIGSHVFALESDIGVFDPWGLAVAADKKLVRTLTDYGADLLKVLGAGNVTSSKTEEPGEDIAILCQSGVPCAGFLSVSPENSVAPGQPGWETHYFRHHHAPSDRVEVIDKHQLRRSAAALAAWAYLIAEL